jgi:DnaJ-class molecular chaperone
MAKDYYVILGVDADATQDQIKSAYRRKAKRCHPDHSGAGSEPFLAVQEAYDVLGDAGRRQAYDDEVAREQRRASHTAGEVGPEPLRGRRCPVEPLVPTGPGSGVHDRFTGSSFPSSMEELLRGPWAGQATRPRPGVTQRANDLHVQVPLTREQALRGGRLRLWVPVRSRCPACRGRGAVGAYGCQHCFGRGTVVDERPVDVAFPGGLGDGFQGRVSLRRLGIGDLSLVLHFQVKAS